MPDTPAEIRRKLREMEAISRSISEETDKNETGLDKRLKGLQRLFFEILVADFILGFDTRGGTITNTARNMSRVSMLDGMFSRLQRSGLVKLVEDFRDQVFDVMNSVTTYFEAGFDRSAVQAVAGVSKQIERALGVKGKRIVRDGYLDRLARTPELVNELKSFFVSGIANQTPVKDITSGLGSIVKGNPDADGFLQRYFRQYAYDTFNEARELKNAEFTDRLGLKHFIYQGSIIKTSRAFCIKRAGKVFTIAETSTWKDDPTLIEKKTKESYSPLIERGRYNCRHWLDYISEAMYNILKERELKKAA